MIQSTVVAMESACRNGLANFTCDCNPGFNGEIDIGEYVHGKRIMYIV